MGNLNPTELAQALETASTLEGLRYENLSPTQRYAAEQALGHFDYFHGYGRVETEEDRKRLFNEAINQFTQDYDLSSLSFGDQFKALIGMFLNAIGFGEQLPELGIEASNLPSANWENGHDAPRNSNTEVPTEAATPGELGASLEIPQGSTQTNNRYRMMVVRTDNDGSDQHATGELVLTDQNGRVVWRADIASGADNRGNGSLPGLGEDLGRAITTTYRIDYNDIRLNRRDRIGMVGMSYTDGSPGYSFTLINPDNIAEIDGEGRNHFRIHPAGVNPGRNLGCIEFPNDIDAREFLRIMQSLPESQRPYGLEVLSRAHLNSIDTGKIIGTEQEGRALANALASAGVSFTSTNISDGVSQLEFQTIVEALQDITDTLVGVDLSNGMDFDNNQIIDARDIRTLTRQLA